MDYPGSALAEQRLSLTPKRRVVFYALVFLLVTLVAVSNDSLWIDECATAYFAAHASLKGAFQEMISLKWPEIQAPLYLSYIWAWAKVVGSSEYLLRFAGAPWFLAGAVLFITSWSEPRKRLCAGMAVGLSPFAWFYLNEARLYSMQIGLALAVMASLIRLNDDANDGRPFRLRWLVVFCSSMVLLSLVNVLGMIWASAAILMSVALFGPRRLLHELRKHWVLGSSTVALLMACGGYYLWTRTLGVAPTNVAKTNWQTLCSILYEQLGFNGLGPGRLVLRQGGFGALKGWLPALGIYFLTLALVLLAAAAQLLQPARRRLTFFAAVALTAPGIFILALAFLTPFRVLGRHFAPFVTVIILVLTIGLARLLQSKTWWSRVGLGAFLLLSLFSCLSQRFSSRHARDDYRGAAAIAKACLARGQSVWWDADPYSCNYYGVPSSTSWDAPGKVWLMGFQETGYEQRPARPDVVVTSTKTDIYDQEGTLHGFLKREGYSQGEVLSAFVIFHRKSDTFGEPPSQTR
jgi:hypothetical protein